MRLLTAGESHGSYNVAILEGFPKGVRIEQRFINEELKRRMTGVGRGGRMLIEEDSAEIVSGLRNKITLGSPIAILIKNKDAKIFAQASDNLASLSIPRPAHADLCGALKYGEKDLRNILERASARETVARVAVGAICKQFLSLFRVRIASFTVGVGRVLSGVKPKDISEIIASRKQELNCIDAVAGKQMIKAIKQAQSSGDSLGGIVEVWVDGLVCGLGSFMHFDKRLDAKLAGYLMSIPAVKGVEIGLGFKYAQERGSLSHDAIYYSPSKKFYRNTNNSGGIEGGISTGSPVVMRVAMKPIATLCKPLESVDLMTKKKEKAMVERCDTCAIVALSVIAEAMSSLAVTESFLEKFSCDSLPEIKRNYQGYLKSIDNL
ncbi:MAG: chorismate synthase [Candidatus Omnitrophota bacterium]